MDIKYKKYKIILPIALSFALVALFFVLASQGNMQVFNPKGVIALKERNLLVLATLLMMTVIVPVFGITAYIVWKYRENHFRGDHHPDWDRSSLLAAVLWFIPSVIIAIISVMIWQSTHDLDPYKSLESHAEPITIQVVALNWKWLFIYPEQGIATINFVEFPKHIPVKFELTADAPMNTFIIPQLGGQVYAMAGMKNQLHLMASEAGTFSGFSTEINGKGYSQMRFVAQSVSDKEFADWVDSVKSKKNPLTSDVYNTLAKDSLDNPVSYYSSTEPNLFHNIIMKFMAPVSN